MMYIVFRNEKEFNLFIKKFSPLFKMGDGFEKVVKHFLLVRGKLAVVELNDKNRTLKFNLKHTIDLVKGEKPKIKLLECSDVLYFMNNKYIRVPNRKAFNKAIKELLDKGYRYERTSGVNPLEFNFNDFYGADTCIVIDSSDKFSIKNEKDSKESELIKLKDVRRLNRG